MTIRTMMSTSHSRQTILDRLRSHPLRAEPLGSIDPTKIVRYDDPVAKFKEMASWVGAAVYEVEGHDEAAAILGAMPEFAAAIHIASTLPPPLAGNVDLSLIDDPHWLASLDWALVAGEFGVAENGAVWVQPRNLSERAMIFIAQYQALFVAREQIVMNMHQAYARLDRYHSQSLDVPRFGIFVSGPSKTADIEQSLVLGAHGCRTLSLFLTN